MAEFHVMIYTNLWICTAKQPGELAHDSWFPISGRASMTTGSTTSAGLQQPRLWNMYNTSNPSLQIPTRQTQLNIPSCNRIMDDTMNNMINQRNRQSLLTNMGASPYTTVQPASATRMLVKDTGSTKRPYSSLVDQSYSVGSWNRNPREMESNQCAFNNTTEQTFEQINSATVLEKISHDLLDDVDIVPSGAAEEAMVMSTVNSLSNLLQQEPVPATAGSSQASYAEPTATIITTPLNVSAEEAITQVLGVAPDAGSSGGSGSRAGDGSGNSMLPSTANMEGLPCEEEQMGEIEMDMAYVSELLPFCP